MNNQYDNNYSNKKIDNPYDNNYNNVKTNNPYDNNYNNVNINNQHSNNYNNVKTNNQHSNSYNNANMNNQSSNETSNKNELIVNIIFWAIITIRCIPIFLFAYNLIFKGENSENFINFSALASEIIVIVFTFIINIVLRNNDYKV